MDLYISRILNKKLNKFELLIFWIFLVLLKTNHLSANPLSEELEYLSENINSKINRDSYFTTGSSWKLSPTNAGPRAGVDRKNYSNGEMISPVLEGLETQTSNLENINEHRQGVKYYSSSSEELQHPLTPPAVESSLTRDDKDSSVIGRLVKILPQVIRLGFNSRTRTAEENEEEEQISKLRSRRSFEDLWYDYDDFEDYNFCSDPPCPLWSEWYAGSCNATCGGGQKFLVRYCNNSIPDENQGGCEGESVKFDNCNMQPCPLWSEWKPAGKCSTTCGEGMRKYTRECRLKNKHAVGCMGISKEYRPCSGNLPCPPQWTSWSRFTSCSKSCGHGGHQLRRRLCLVAGAPVMRSKVPCFGHSSQQRRCHLQPRCPSTYTNWEPWTHCDAITCDVYGSQSRYRKCIDGDGKELPEKTMNCKADRLYQRRTCRSESCATACTVVVNNWKQRNQTSAVMAISTTPVPTWSQWTDWTSCSISCGFGGQQTRSRMCFGVRLSEENNTVILNQDKNCNGRSIQYRGCHYSHSCPRWDTWMKWDQCTRTCGFSGRKRRERECVFKSYDVSIFHEMQRQEDQENVIDWILEGSGGSGSGEGSGEGSGDELVLLSYPIGLLYTSRLYQHPRDRKVVKTVVLDSNLCGGGENKSVMISTCNEHHCPPKWGAWQSWSECGVTCGAGQSQRIRRCLGRGDCHGDKIQFRTCYQPPCWGDWSAYSPCTTSCGGGIKTRFRKCRGATLHIPEYAQCRGEKEENMTCSEEKCPKWAEWTAWGECSVQCGGGSKIRTRECELGICRGRSIDQLSCNYQPCPYWDQWSTFSCCSVSCGEGVKKRRRNCRHWKRGYQECKGEFEDVQPCYPGACNATVDPELNSFQCGIKPVKATAPAILRIYNGKVSNDHEWPWQVSWQHFSCANGMYDCAWKHLCGATLLGPKWVVTAGHCIEEWDARVVYDDPGDSWSVVVGMTKLYQDGDRYLLRRVFLHPEYEYRGVPKSDIALLKLRTAVPIREHSMPACLPEHTIPSKNEECYVTGWGNLSPRSGSSKDLRHAKIPVMEFGDCQNLGYFYRNYLSKKAHMCAGDTKKVGAADSCRGDSGGPMVCVRPDGKWYLAGVTSFGFKDCGTAGEAGIYVPMTEYEDWVRTTIKENSHNGC